MGHNPTRERRQGFTLVEVLAAFAVASVVIVATAALMHNLVLSFDRGTGRVDAGERLLLAADRLAADIGAARFVLQTTPAGKIAAFRGEPTRITFISAALIDPARQDDDPVRSEIVSVTARGLDDATELVRSRARWSDPRMRIEDAVPQDDVVLLSGRFDAAFKFARVAADGALSWSSSWIAERSLPRLVKLSLIDRTSGIDLLGGAEFVLRADAPLACARASPSLECLTGAAAGQPPPPPPPAGGARQ
jgi:prepilin-type N-terminal cleavage/methylation domain-containing protein